jgi:hypothetical protein
MRRPHAVFVQAVDEAGTNFTSSPGPGKFTAFVGAIGGQAGNRMRKIKTDVFDQGDGTYQVRREKSTLARLLRLLASNTHFCTRK